MTQPGAAGSPASPAASVDETPAGLIVGAEARPQSAFAPLPRAFRQLLAAELVSLFGSLVGRTALPFVAILFLDARPMAVALLGVADIVAGFASALLLGAWVDRWPKRRTMLVADVARAVLMATVPLAAWLGFLSMPLLFAVALGCGVLGVAFELAYAALLPRLVEPAALLHANSRVAAGSAVVETASFGLGGWLVQWLSAPLAVLVDAVSFAVSALLVWRAKVPADGGGASAAAPSVWREASEGIHVIRRDPILRALAAVEFFVAGGSAMYGAVFLLFLSRELHFAPGVLGLIFAVGGLSSFAGAMLAEKLGRRWPAGPLMICGLALMAASMFLPALATSAGIVGILLLIGQQAVGDGGFTLYQINDTVLRQTRAPPEALARVVAGIRFVGLAAMLMGAVAAGWLAELASARAAIVVAACCATVAVAAALASKLRGLGSDPPEAPEPH